MLLASVRMPDATVVATAPEFEMLTVGVPVTVKLVTVAVVQSVPPLPMQVMLPVPKARVRGVAAFELKKPHVCLKPFRFQVSPVPPVDVQVNVRSAPIVKLLNSLYSTEFAPEEQVTGELIVVVPVFMVFMPENAVLVVKLNVNVDALQVAVHPVKSMLPVTLKVPVVCVKVTVPADAVKS